MISGKITHFRSSLESVQAQLQTDWSNAELHAQEKENIAALKKWVGIEESILRQKSRATWLRLGDENSHFFFSEA